MGERYTMDSSYKRNEVCVKNATTYILHNGANNSLDASNAN